MFRNGDKMPAIFLKIVSLFGSKTLWVGALAAILALSTYYYRNKATNLELALENSKQKVSIETAKTKAAIELLDSQNLKIAEYEIDIVKINEQLLIKDKELKKAYNQIKTDGKTCEEKLNNIILLIKKWSN
jgi:predicted RNase H-like nuclease (RuvC/YqgF family)